MNDLVLLMKKMKRAMRPYVFTLYEIVLESKPDWVLEIGVGQAQSTRVILSALKENKKGKLVSICRRDRSEKITEDLLPYWEHVVGDSHDFKTFSKVFGRRYSLLLIDGDHSYLGVKGDFKLYSQLVKNNGFILMHDICNKNEGVKDFWPEIKYPKIALEYGLAKNKIVPGMGIVQKYEEV